MQIAPCPILTTRSSWTSRFLFEIKRISMIQWILTIFTHYFTHWSPSTLHRLKRIALESSSASISLISYNSSISYGNFATKKNTFSSLHWINLPYSTTEISTFFVPIIRDLFENYRLLIITSELSKKTLR